MEEIDEDIIEEITLDKRTEEARQRDISLKEYYNQFYE